MIRNTLYVSNDLAKQVAKRIKEIRINKGLTQEQVAKASGMKYKYYQEIEGKNPRDMRLSTLGRIAKGLNTDLLDFF